MTQKEEQQNGRLTSVTKDSEEKAVQGRIAVFEDGCTVKKVRGPVRRLYSWTTSPEGEVVTIRRVYTSQLNLVCCDFLTRAGVNH